MDWSDDLLHFIFANEIPNMVDSVSTMSFGIDVALVDTS